MDLPDPLERLVPPPRSVTRLGGRLDLSAGVALDDAFPPDIDPRPAAWLRRALPAAGGSGGGSEAARVVLARGRELAPGAYRLEVRPGDRTLLLEADSAAGHLAAVATLLQLLAGARGLPGLVVEDAPCFSRRGYMLDVSRDRVPPLTSLLELVERLALLKFNELQLYVEHAFAYPGHEDVWRDASPLTAEDLRTLDAHAHAHGIDLVPNQNSLGHWHRWLVHPRYRDLAEVPEGVPHAFHLDPQPFSLCPTDPRVLPLLGELYDAYLPCFRSGEFNVGLDEADDVGRGRSRAAGEDAGPGRVYLEHLLGVHRLVRERGRRMQFWGDILVRHPRLVPELPRDLVALEWGYEAGHPFQEHGALFAASGLDVHVCPGTSTWQSLTGRLGNLRANLAEAAAAGLEHGARGYLVTDWGDYGHWQAEVLSWPGIVLGASWAWSGREPAGDLAEHLARSWAGADPGARELARLVLELATVSEATGCRTVNGTPFFFLLKFVHEPLDAGRLPLPEADALVEAVARLASISGSASTLAAEPGLSLHARELALGADLAALAARIGLARLEHPASAPLAAVVQGRRAELARELDALVERYRELWPLRSRPGGLRESAGRLLRSRDSLLAPVEMAP